MTDLITRLRRDKWHVTAVDCEAAADEIERLRFELAEAVTALPQAVRNEREACALALERTGNDHCAAALRARGEA